MKPLILLLALMLIVNPQHKKAKKKKERWVRDTFVYRVPPYTFETPARGHYISIGKRLIEK